MMKKKKNGIKLANKESYIVRMFVINKKSGKRGFEHRGTNRLSGKEIKGIFKKHKGYKYSGVSDGSMYVNEKDKHAMDIKKEQKKYMMSMSNRMQYDNIQGLSSQYDKGSKSTTVSMKKKNGKIKITRKRWEKV